MKFMITIFFKLNYKGVLFLENNNLEARGKATMKVGIIGIAGNIMLFVIKILIALASKSQALFADSVNSATDILSSIMTLIGGKISSEPSDAEHNYGHGKAEYIFSLLISIVMAYLAIKIAYDGTFSLIKGAEFTFSYLLVAVCIITIITKLLMYLYVHKIGVKMDNILILANSQDHINDVWTTTSVLIGIVFALFNIYWVDGVVAIMIATKILFEAIKIFMESYNVLMDVSMPKSDLEKIKDIIANEKEIDHIDKVTSKSVGNEFIVIVKVSIDGNKTVNESHHIVGKLKSEIMKLKGVYDVIVHVNPA